jgi:hypothetical protein
VMDCAKRIGTLIVRPAREQRLETFYSLLSSESYIKPVGIHWMAFSKRQCQAYQRRWPHSRTSPRSSTLSHSFMKFPECRSQIFNLQVRLLINHRLSLNTIIVG